MSGSKNNKREKINNKLRALCPLVYRYVHILYVSGPIQNIVVVRYQWIEVKAS